MKTTQREGSREGSPRHILRWGAALLLAGFLLGSLLPSMGGKVEAAPQRANATHIVISEFRTRGPNGGYDEFIELYNPTSGTIDIGTWEIWGSNASGSTSLRATIPVSVNLAAGKHYLIANTRANGYSGAYDVGYTTGITDNGGVALLSGGTEIDKVGMSTGSAYYETSPLSPLSGNNNQSYERKFGGGNANSIDNDDNSNDFLHNDGSSNMSNPQTFSDAATFCGTSSPDLIINEVAWAGTEASSDDEWIELYSPLGGNFNLTDWRLVAEDGSPDIVLSGFTSSDGYFLLERAREENVTTGITDIDGGVSNQIYSGKLEDTGEILRLRAPDGTIVDTANANGGAWSHGRISPASSMERMSTSADTDNNWVTNIGTHANGNSNGQDAAGNDIYGSPGQKNWGYSVTYTPTNTATPTSTGTSTPLPPTQTPTATATATAPASLTVLINEVGWSGTSASSTDEWIELYNASDFAVDFDAGWKLISTDGGIDITLTGTLADGNYYLLERTDDNTISDIAADLIYSGSLSNDGEYLKLLAPDGSVVDTANNDGGSWPAGSASPNYGSMERNGIVTDKSSSWFTNTGAVRNGLDAEGNKINGTPKQANWAISVTATASPKPSATYIYIPSSSTPTSYPYQSIVLNEVLPRPGHDWNGDGIINTNDEFIEIINRGNSDASLSNWKLQITSDSSTYALPNITLKAGGRVAIFGNTSHLHLSDKGDTVRLLKSNNQISDVVTYTIATTADHSWCRFPEHGYWNPNCFPTPHEENALHGDFNKTPYSIHALCPIPDTVPEAITLVECSALGTNIISADFWDYDSWEIWITGRAKHPTWVR